MRRIVFEDNLEALRTLPTGSVDLIYIDPPFNTGKTQRRTQLSTIGSSKEIESGLEAAVTEPSNSGQDNSATDSKTTQRSWSRDWSKPTGSWHRTGRSIFISTTGRSTCAGCCWMSCSDRRIF